MAEQPPRSKASEVVEQLRRRAAPKEERKLPELRLRADAPALAIDETTPAQGVLDRLRISEVGALALREPDAEPAAVVISAERYLELIGKELLTDRSTIASNGRRMLMESALAGSYVEQVNPYEAVKEFPRQVH